MRTMFQSLIVLMMAPAAFTQQPAQPLTMQRAVELYIARNLELEAARYRLERAKADPIAARLQPNPVVTVVAENFAVNSPQPFNRLYEVGATYTETIELGQKRKLREQVANTSVSVAEAQFMDAMRRGIAGLKRAYYDAVLARMNVETATENRQTFERLVQFNQARLEEGAIAESELIKVRLERMKFDSALKQAQLHLRQSMIRLLERLGESSFPNAIVAGDLEFTADALSLEALRQTALSERPDIEAASREAAAARERLALEHARAKADVSPFVGYKRVATDNTILFGVTLPLRTRDRNQAGIARAETDIKAAETQLKQAQNRAMAEVEAAYDAFQSARDQVQAFRGEMLGQADESRNIALAAYEEGGTDLLPLLEAERTRAEVRMHYFRTLFEYRSSLIDLELAVGRESQP